MASKFSIKISTKFILLSVALVSLTALITDQIYYRSTEEILFSAEIETLEEEARLLINPVRRSITTLKSDVQVLYATPSLLSVLVTPDIKNFDALAGEFRALIRSAPNYSRINLIDQNGQELLRVDRRGNVVTEVTGNQLKNRSGESYFREALSVDSGEVYLSDIEPNREDGQVVRPVVQVLRAAIPLYRQDESLAGVLVINLNMSRLLKELTEDVNDKRQLYVTNNEGEYLWHPDREQTLGVKRQRFTIQDEFPKSQQVVEGEKRRLLAETLDGKILSYIALPFDALNPDRTLGVGLTAKREVLLKEIHETRKQNLLLTLFLAAAAMMIAAFFSRLITRPLVHIAALADKFPDTDDTGSLPIQKQDEIGVLARSYSRLVEEVRQQSWIRNGQLNAISAIRSELSVKDTAYEVLKSLCSYMDFPLGALYEVQDDGSLVLLSGYAIDGSAKAKEKLAARDSVLASVLADGKIKVDNHLPDHYYRIHSGLGDMLPAHRMVAPIMTGGSAVALIEFGAVRAVSEQDALLVERVSEAIGLALIAARSREDVASMLEESKQQEEELRLANESLETQARDLEESQQELREQAVELEQANVDMERQNREMEQHNKRLEQQKQYIEHQSVEIQRRSDDIERVSNYKSEFLANMSHELRTPLNSLLILAKSFQDNDEGNLTDEQVEEARMIYEGGVELLTLINDVLDFSKIEAGKTVVIKDHVPVDVMVRKLVQQFMPAAKQKALKLTSKVAESIPETLYTDAQRVEQILKNLISNAIKFTETGAVTLEVEPRDDAMLAFSVRDTGIGIHQDKQQDIFEAFKQEEGSIDRRYGGTGLGLSISRQLAQLLGGDITLESEKGRGSCFTLTLPLSAIETETETGPAQTENLSEQVMGDVASVLPLSDSAPNPAGLVSTNTGDATVKTLLVVEDDARFAKTLAKLSDKQGYQTLVAGTGKEALIMVHQYRPSGIILDLMLPDMDGMQVLRQLKSDLKTRHIPVHVISAKDTKASDVIRKGAIGYLSKPVSPEQMASMFASVANVHQDSLKRVLVVEDDAKAQAAIEKLLKNKDLEIVTVGTGHEGLNILQKQKLDCVILDLQLPDMVGFEWLQQAEAIKGTDVPPVIIYTARNLTRDEIRALEEYTGSIIIKGAHSPERLVDEVMLFLHSLESGLSDEQRRTIAMQHNPNEVLDRRKILLVDDDMRNVFAISKMLKKQGMQIIIADNGTMALEQLDKNPDIAVVIMDIMMPVMDGYEAIAKIRQHPGYGKVPVIALTARMMPDERNKCLAAGANDYLPKPVDIDVLLTLMRVLLFTNDKAS